MKILITACLFSLWSLTTSAQSAGISVLNPAFTEIVNDEKIYNFYQGQTIIVAMDDQLKTDNRKWIQALLLGNIYYFNSNGIVLVGIDMKMKPGEYPMCLDLRCNDSDRQNELRIKILKSDFPKTRVARYTYQPKQRQDKQMNIIEDAYSKYRYIDDMTIGSPYFSPMDLRRDIIDPYGLIYGNNEYLAHRGVDLKARVGTPVRAINRGQVALIAKKFRREGNMIIIAHGSGIYSVYMHLSKFSEIKATQNARNGKKVIKKRQLRAGDIVEAGQIIGLSGKTGAGVREPHLHFNIRIKNIYVDPLFFIDTLNQYLK